MKKIIYLIIICVGLGMYGGYKLNDLAKALGFDLNSIGKVTGDLSSNVQSMKNGHLMPDGSFMGNDIMPIDMSMDEMMTAMNKGLENKSENDFDQEFLKEMIVHHQGAVDMAKLVLQKSKRPELLKMANDIINVQTKEIETMKTWQATWFATSTAK